MIRVKIERSSADHSILDCKVDGHANYANPGQDIVCAGVSAVTVGTVNAIEALLGIQLESDVETGLLHFTVPQPIDQELSAKVQLLLESMVVMLQSIRESYGKYISIQDINRRRR